MYVTEYCHGFEFLSDLDFDKGNGLIPVVVQDAQTAMVLMVGWMNYESLEKTIKTRLVTFYSRSRNKLWTKGEESGNFLHLRSIACDCDKDTLLVLARPDGPTCHLGTTSCFDKSPQPDAISRYLAWRHANESCEKN